jgi:protein-disulfide isomerase/uncharacterized membrane protein YphA (DoxX/SURF4 family)
VWLFAAVPKIGDPDAAVRAVRAYQVLPEFLVEPLAWGLPAVELALAVLLVTGLAPRPAAWASVVILAVFVAGMASAWARGLQIDCGCFGSGGPADVEGFDYALEIARDVAFVGVALVAALGREDGLRIAARLPEGLRTRAGQAVILVLTLSLAAAVGTASAGRRSALGSGERAAPTARGTSLVHGTPWTVGRRDAPVVVEVFEDFTCHTCRRFHDEVEPSLAPLVENGTALVAYHPMPTKGDDGVRAAAAAACAYEVGAFSELRDALFAAQDALEPLNTRRLTRIAASAGIADPAFEKCVRARTYVGWVRERLDAGSRRGVVITPTVFVDNVLVRYPLHADDLVTAIRQLAARP